MAPEKFIFLIGAPKCATTTLAAALAARPDVHQHGRTKEPRFFTDFARTDWQGPGTEHFRRTLVSDRKAYLEGFPLASRDDWALDASTDYLWCPASCDLIRRFAAESEVKVIAVLRDPIERGVFGVHAHDPGRVSGPDFQVFAARRRGPTPGRPASALLSHPARTVLRSDFRLPRRLSRRPLGPRLPRRSHEYRRRVASCGVFRGDVSAGHNRD